MAVTDTNVLSNSLQTLLQADFIIAARRQYAYSQPPLIWAPPHAVLSQSNRAQTVSIPIYGHLKPSVTAISQTADVSPITSWDKTISVTPDMYGQTVQLSQKLQLTATPDVIRASAEQVAQAAGESRDMLARAQVIAGGVVIYGGDATSRATVSAGSSTDEIDYADFLSGVTFLKGGRAPLLPGIGAGVAAITRDAIVADMVEDGTIILVAEYGQHPEFLLNGEVGSHMAGARIVVSNMAKIFQGAGTSAAASSGALATAAAGGSTTFTLNSSVSSGGTGQYWCVGAIESTGNNDQIGTETVFISGGSDTTVVTIVGAGANAGFMYAHSSGELVSHAYQVYTTIFMSAEALLMCYTNEDGLGPDGIIYPPEEAGTLKQFTNLGYKQFLGFARTAENRLFRVEHASARFTLGN